VSSSRRAINTRRLSRRRRSKTKEKLQLVPVDATVLASHHLCQHCEECVRFFLPSQPYWLNSGSYLDSIDRIYDEKGAPTLTHSSYRSFATAVSNGCLICNTLLQSMPGRMVSAIQKASWDLSRDGLTTFSQDYLECDEYDNLFFRCCLRFSISSPSRNEANRLKVKQAFILQGESGEGREAKGRSWC
jgi:hypothetical protein